MSEPQESITVGQPLSSDADEALSNDGGAHPAPSATDSENPASQPRWRIWIAGQGGQGVAFLGQLLCRAALMSQRHALARADQQWAIRGGRASASVLIHEQAFSQAEISDYNWLVCLHPAARELVPPLAPDAVILDAYEIEAWRLAQSAGFAQGMNMVMLGLLLARSEACPVDAVVWQLRHLLGREQMSALPYNLELFERGLALGGEYAGHS